MPSLKLSSSKSSQAKIEYHTTQQIVLHSRSIFFKSPVLALPSHSSSVYPRKLLKMPSSSSTPGATINQNIERLPQPVADKIPHVPETKAELKEDVKEAGQKSLAGLRSLAAGGFGGVCAVVVGHPFDLVKVRLQTAERGVYNGALDVVRKSIARDGLRRGLYAGVSAPLVGVTPMCESSSSLFH